MVFIFRNADIIFLVSIRLLKKRIRLSKYEFCIFCLHNSFCHVQNSFFNVQNSFFHMHVSFIFFEFVLYKYEYVYDKYEFYKFLMWNALTYVQNSFFFHESGDNTNEYGCEIMSSACVVCGFHFLMCRTRTKDINTLDFIMSTSAKL